MAVFFFVLGHVVVLVGRVKFKMLVVYIAVFKYVGWGINITGRRPQLTADRLRLE